MQQHYLTKTFNIVTLIFCVMVMIVSSKELFFTPLEFSNTTPLAKIGFIKNFENQAKVKKYFHFSWNDAAVKGVLNTKDLIFTNKNSEIELSLNQNSVKLFEETMIQLEDHNQLEVTKGNVEFLLTGSDRPLKIILGNKVFILKSNKAKIKITQGYDKQARIAVSEGDVQVTLEKEQKTINVNADQALTFTEDSYQVTSAKIQCLYPLNEKIISSDLRRKLEFKTDLIAIDSATLLVAKDKDFKNIILENRDYSGVFKSDFVPGKYFWKVQTKDQKSSIQSFEIYYHTGQELRSSPLNNHSEISYQKTTQVQFHWKNLYGETQYTLQVFDVRGEIIFNKMITATSFIWNTTLSGQFTWELIPHNPYFLAANTKRYQFTIEKQDYTKADALVIELTKPDQLVEFKWQQNKNTSYSLFELANDPSFKSVIVSKKLFRSKTKITFPKVGVFYWRSHGIDRNGKKIMNKPIKVLIRPTPPPSKPKKLPDLKLQVNSNHVPSFWNFFIASAHADTGGKAILDWPALSDAKLYEIEIFSDNKLENRIKKITTKGSKYKWNVPRTGKFYWRYRYKDFWGRFSPYSDASELIITKKKPLKEIKKSKKIVKEIKAPKKPKKSINFISLSYAPALINYTQKNNNKYSIDGPALSGLEVDYVYLLKNYHHLNFNLKSHSGLVFENEKFFYQNLLVNYHYPVLGGFVSAGFRYVRMPSYTTENTRAIYDASVATTLIDVAAKYLWQEINLLTQFNLGFGAATYFELKLSYEIYSNKDFILKAHASMITSSLELDESDINSQQYQLAIGPEYNF